MSEESDPPLPPPRRLLRRRIVIAVAWIAAALGIAHYGRIKQEEERQRSVANPEPVKPSGIPPSGGKHFASRVLIEVPSFLQNDPLWGQEPLGPSPTDTLGSAGCAVASCAMVLASYGVDTDPRRLNEFLNSRDGFTPEAWLKWEVGAELSPDKVRFVYEDVPSYQLIDENLERGNPVIVRIRYASGITHFVVIRGKEGYDYLINDPGRHGGHGAYPLKQLGSNIEALRFYEPLKQG